MSMRDHDIQNLADKHGGTWGEHPDYPIADWQYQVANEHTRKGYWEWISDQILEKEVKDREVQGYTPEKEQTTVDKEEGEKATKDKP
jgi:hypothetical protein